MNIIWITSELPFPANTGGKIVMFERIKYLSHKNKIFLFAFINNPKEKEFKNNLLKYCAEVKLYNKEKNIFKIIKCIINPYSVEIRSSKRLMYDLYSFIEDNAIDIINIDFPQVSKNILNIKNIPIVLNQHNIEYLSFKSIAQNENNILKKTIYYFEYLKMSLFEKCLYNKKIFSGITFVSSDDEKIFKKKYKFYNTQLIPVGVNINNLIVEKKIADNNFIFIGKMNYMPNIQAMKWFCDKIWPKIKSNLKNANLYIVGKDPTVDVIKLKSESIIVTGTVESVKPYLDIASVYIIPLQSGGGVKVKLLEALGSGQLVVTTSKGIEGTEFKHHKHVLVANDEQSFADACIDASTNRTKYHYLVENSKELILNKYLWQVICENYFNYLNNILKM